MLDKEHTAVRKGIFMIDASKGFIKDGNKNRLRAQDIHEIVDAFTRQLHVDQAVRTRMQDGWRTNSMKPLRVRQAIAAVLNGEDARVDRILALVQSQNDY